MTSEEKIDLCLKHLEKQGEMIARINRGLYGDPDNKLPGLIDRQISDEHRIAKLEKHNDRQKWWTGGAIATFTVLGTLIWNWLTKVFK